MTCSTCILFQSGRCDLEWGFSSSIVFSAVLFINLLSYHGLYLIICLCLITSYCMWSHDYVCRPIRSFCSCLSCFYVFSCFYVLLTVCVVVFYQWHFIDLFSCKAASLFNKITYLLTIIAQKIMWNLSAFSKIDRDVREWAILWAIVLSDQSSQSVNN